MTQLAFDLEDVTTVPGYVHGIVSIDPPQIRCDGCGYTATGTNLNLLILTCGIDFDPMSDNKRRRLCRDCHAARKALVLGSDAARAVGRFNPQGPTGYRAKSAPGAPLRATRAEAEADERVHRESHSIHPTVDKLS